MKRRKLIYTAMGIAGTSALGSCGLHLTQPSVRWNMATSWPTSLQPTSLDIIYGAAEIVCQRVSEMTDGRFVITPYPADEKAPALKVLDAVEDGTVECGHTCSYYYTKRNLALAFGAAVPFGLNARQQNAWLSDEGGGLELMQSIYADFGVINFPAGNTGVQMGGWFNKPIKTVADMEGLKMRIPGLGGEVMEKLGVEVINVPPNRISEAMKNGEIDAAEWIGPHDDEQLGLHKVASYCCYPGWWEPGTSFEVQVNRDKWEKLPKTYQEVFKAACVEANLKTLARYDKLNRLALGRLKDKRIKFLPYSEEILKSAEKAAFDIYEAEAKRNKKFKEVYKQWKVFREQTYQWHGTSELEFSKFSLKE